MCIRDRSWWNCLLHEWFPQVLSLALNCITKTLQSLQIMLFIHNLDYWCVVHNSSAVEKKESASLWLCSSVVLFSCGLGDDGVFHCSHWALVSVSYPVTQDSSPVITFLRITIGALQHILCNVKINICFIESRYFSRKNMTRFFLNRPYIFTC